MRYLFLFLIMLATLGCENWIDLLPSEGDEGDSPVGVVGNEGDTPDYYSEYHIDGWLTDWECWADLEGVKDILVFGHLIQGYTGKGVVTDQSGEVRFKTLEEAGISDNENVKFLPNGKYSVVIAESDWADLKAYILKKLALTEA